MSAIAVPAAMPPVRTILIALGLTAVVFGRWAATASLVAGPITVGMLFGAGLLAVGLAAGSRVERPGGRSIAIGLGAGAILVCVAVLGRGGSSASTFPPGVPFAPWALATVLVAMAEELVLRGALLDAIAERGGLPVAIAVTSAAFALMHVPLYGWHVVPLDLGVGLWLAGLRIAFGGVAAPGIAHAVADLATYWL